MLKNSGSSQLEMEITLILLHAYTRLANVGCEQKIYLNTSSFISSINSENLTNMISNVSF